MTILDSKLNPRSDEFKANAAAMQAVVDDLKAKVAKIALGGGEDARKKHAARGKLLPRLVDIDLQRQADEPFFECRSRFLPHRP